MRNTFIKTLADVAESNPNVWLLCGDLGFSVLEPFAARFPDRYINIGVAEQNMAGIAAGIALSGKTVFIYSIGNFPTLRCLEQLRNDVCYHGADVKVVAVGAGFAYGSQGYTHHAIEDVAIMGALPGMQVFVPCDPMEVETATRKMAQSGKPSYLRLSRSGEPNLHAERPADLGSAKCIRQGKDVTILASGPIAGTCLQAADMLSRSGIDASVFSVPCLKPFDDTVVLDLAGQGRPMVTVEEHILRGGLFAAAAAAMAGVPHAARLTGLGIPEPAEKSSLGGDRESLLARVGLSAEAIAARVRKALPH